MNETNAKLQNFLRGALGYLAGAAAGIMFLFLAARLGLVHWLAGLIDFSQILVRLVSIPVFAGLVLAVAGGILGIVGGLFLAGILGVRHKWRQVTGSAVAFAISVSVLVIFYLLLLGFIGIYNNFTDNRVDQYLLIFGLMGLVFGLLTGIVQSFISLRLRDGWRLILAATLGFTLGGVLTGLLVWLVNPTAGYQTYPLLTTIVLLLALVMPFVLGGGAMGYVYGRLAGRAAEKGVEVEKLQPSIWQTALVSLLGLMAALWFLGTLDHITEFLTIYRGNTRTQIGSETVGVRWNEPAPYAGDVQEAVAIASVTGPDDVVYTASCGADGVVRFQEGNLPVEEIHFPACAGTPVLALGQDGTPHVVWYTTEIRDTTGEVRSERLLVESIRTAVGWSEPAIVSRVAAEPRLNLTSDKEGNLLLDWQEPDQEAQQAVQQVYTCDESQLSELEQTGLQSMEAEETRPPGTVIPFCRNQYDGIVYTPNPEPAYSDEPATPNSAFDYLAQAIRTKARYEILFATMQYEPSESPPSPGNVLAEGVAALYHQVKAHPEEYPRGMTVRILLGNYPTLSTLEYGSQIKDAISDFRAAGVESMEDPSIGWRLEFANFPGSYPHSHTKFLVVDGQQVTGAGFNYGYLHFPKDHPSGRGYDLFDLGLSLSGPVAQDAVSVYDDMWRGADQVYCSDLYPEDGSDWRDTCVEKQAVADHMPEVLRYYLPPGGDSHAFSLYRNSVFKESDEFIAADLAASANSIDMMQTNFSLELVCMLDLIFPDFCDIDDALPWMDAMLEAIENNHTHVRVIMENTNSNGLENRVAGRALMEEVTRLGLEDLVELRFYNGKIHAKSILIDGELLFIGSQNLHYSAWGPRGLNEYNVATDDPDAIAEYQALFEYKWEQAIPFEEAEYGTSP